MKKSESTPYTLRLIFPRVMISERDEGMKKADSMAERIKE